MRNKTFIFIIFFLILSNCGYQPIYSTKNFNFAIGNVEKENTSLNNKFARSINALTNRESEKEIWEKHPSRTDKNGIINCPFCKVPSPKGEVKLWGKCSFCRRKELKIE